MLANSEVIIVVVFIFIIIFFISVYVGRLNTERYELNEEDDENSENKDVVKEQSEFPKIKTSKPKEINTPQINLPKFKDSGWVLFYVIFGGIGLVAMIVFIVEEESTFAFMMLGCSLSCFFGAHVLRLQEKVAFHAERQTELLEKLSSEKSSIIEDKEK